MTGRRAWACVTALAVLVGLTACDADGSPVDAAAPSGSTTAASAASSAPSSHTPTPDAVTDEATATESAAAGRSTGLYVRTDTQAATAWAQATGEDKALLARIAQTPQAAWIGDWTAADAARDQVRALTTAARDAHETATFVVYAIPGRDCGLHSAGGVSASRYASWVDTVAAGVVGRPIVVLEPDALAQLGDCDGQGDRVGFLAYAAAALDAAGADVYLDAGHSGWLAADEVVRRIGLVGTEHLAGFALNTSNYQSTSDERAYGERIASRLDGLGFVIDTSRNGNGSNGEWCNPRGRALGEAPRLVDDGTALDALLWVKSPGESDGACNGGPDAGRWWQEIALELARNAS